MCLLIIQGGIKRLPNGINLVPLFEKFRCSLVDGRQSPGPGDYNETSTSLVSVFFFFFSNKVFCRAVGSHETKAFTLKRLMTRTLMTRLPWLIRTRL